jgi:hypothetical protein
MENDVMTEQQKEIETIEERHIGIDLSDADVKRLCEKAGSVGLSVNELLRNFIGDLVGGTYTNGSDERDLASQWFNRCWFGMFPDKTFLRYLNDWTFNAEDIVELWGMVKSTEKDIENADESDKDDIEGWKEDLSYWKEELDQTFSEFKDWAKGDTIGTLDDEMATVLKWYEEMMHIKESGSQVSQEI